MSRSSLVSCGASRATRAHLAASLGRFIFTYVCNMAPQQISSCKDTHSRTATHLSKEVRVLLPAAGVQVLCSQIQDVSDDALPLPMTRKTPRTYPQRGSGGPHRRTSQSAACQRAPLLRASRSTTCPQTRAPSCPGCGAASGPSGSARSSVPCSPRHTHARQNQSHAHTRTVALTYADDVGAGDLLLEVAVVADRATRQQRPHTQSVSQTQQRHRASHERSHTSS